MPNRIGYLTDDDVRERLGSEGRYAEFVRWMDGQTTAMKEDGSVLYYPWDFERFVRGLPVVD